MFSQRIYHLKNNATIQNDASPHPPLNSPGSGQNKSPLEFVQHLPTANSRHVPLARDVLDTCHWHVTCSSREEPATKAKCGCEILMHRDRSTTRTKSILRRDRIGTQPVALLPGFSSRVNPSFILTRIGKMDVTNVEHKNRIEPVALKGPGPASE